MKEHMLSRVHPTMEQIGLFLCVLLLLISTFTSLSAQDSGNALDFDGVDDYVDLPDGMMSSVNSFTVEAWIKWDGASGNSWERVIDFGNSTTEYGFLTLNGNNSYPAFALKVEGQIEESVESSVGLTKKVWQHLAFTLDDASGIGTIYIDGEVVGTGSIFWRFDDMIPTVNNWIGRSQFSADPYYDGDLDEIRVWNTVRSQIDIQDNMFTELVGSELGLMAYYNMNEGQAYLSNSTSIATDVTGNGYSGTLLNFALTDVSSNWVESQVLDLEAWHPFTLGSVLDFAGGNGGTWFPDIFQTADRFGITGSAISFQNGYVQTDLLMVDDDPFSIAGWVNWDGSSGFHNIVSMHDGALARTMLGPNGDDSGNIRFGDSWPTTGAFLPANQWVHILATYDGNSRARIYLDGVLQAENLNVVGGYNFKQSSPSFYIGTISDGSEPFLGLADDIRIYSTDLSDPAIPGQTALTRYPVSDTEIQLSWFDAGNSDGYRIFRSTDQSNWTQIADLDALTFAFTDTGLTENTVYFYYIDSYNSFTSISSFQTHESTFSTSSTTMFETFNVYSSDGFDYGRAVAFDGSGNYYFWGVYGTDISFDGNVLSNTNGAEAMYLVKFDFNDSFVWAVPFNPTIDGFAHEITISGTDEIYVSGEYAGSMLSLPETPQDENLNYYANGFITKLDSDGNEIWSRAYTESGYGSMYGLDTDSNGDVYVSGDFDAAGTFAGLSIPGSGGGIIFKFDSDGSELWADYGDSSDDQFLGLSIDGNDDILVSGNFYNASTFGNNFGTPITINSTGDRDGMVLKYNPDGSLQWINTVGSDDGNSDQAFDLTIDASENVYLGGHYFGTSVTFPNGTFSNSNANDELFLVKYDTNGNEIWGQSFGGIGEDLLFNLATDGSNVYMTGIKEPFAASFGSQNTTNGRYYLANVDEDGNVSWVDIAEGNMRGRGMIFYNDYLYIPGRFRYNINVGGTYYSSSNQSSDTFLGKVPIIQIPSIGVSASDSLALVALYQATDGDNWIDNTNWLTGPVASWTGITLSEDGLRVEEVFLDNNNLTGTLPTSIGQLTAVTSFSTTGNNISGSIPVEIGDMTSLRNLSLDDNDITGSIPIELANVALQELYLNRNQLTGSIPSEFGGTTSLTHLSLYSNSLTGTIPPELENLTGLQILDVEDNLFIGLLPSFLGNMTSLQQIWLGGCAFSGGIPISFGNLPSLTHLILGDNDLIGSVPGELGNLTSLTHLDLSDNDFTGELPTAIGILISLEEVYLDNNVLSGPIPDGLSAASNLRIMSVSGNYFETIPNFSSTSLEELYVANNEFTFEDLLPNAGVPTAIYDYAPQNLVGDAQTRFAAQDVDYTLDLFFDNGVSGSTYAWSFNQVGFVNTSTNFLDFTPITVSQDGEWQVSITNPTLPDLTLITETITLNVQNICVSAPDNSTDTKINRFLLSDLDNITGVDGSDCQSYSNFTHLTATIYPTQAFDVGIELGTCDLDVSKVAAFYMDSNQDGSFDESTERVFSFGPITGTQFLQETLLFNTPPQTGTFLLRVIVQEGTDPSQITGCGTYGFGETEDYTINIVDGSADLVIDLVSATPVSMFSPATPLTSGDDMLVTTNIGNSGLITADVTKGINYYLSTDQTWDVSADFDLGSISISGLANGDVVTNSDVIVNTTSVPEGTYYLIVVADPDNTLNDPDFTDNISVSSIPLYIGPPLVTDTTPPTINITDSPSVYVLGDGGATVTASISDDTALDFVTFSYATVEQLTDVNDVAQYTSVFPEELTPGVYSHTIPNDAFRGIGAAYFFGALDEAGNSATSLPLPQVIPIRFGSTQVDTPAAFGVSSADGATDADYKLFSVPVRDATVGSALGITTMTKDKLRVYRYSNGSNQEITSSTTQLAIGSGYWLIYVSGEVSFDFSGLAASSTNENLFTYNLTSGINLIGNPYNFPISWSDIVAHNVNEGILSTTSDVSSGITTFNRGFAGGQNRLGVGEAGFINANLNVNLEVPFSAETTKAHQGARFKRNSIDSDIWEVGLNIDTEYLKNHVAAIGMNPDAVIGLDNFDHPALPYLSEYIEFNSKNGSLPARISQDMVETGRNHIWEFEATTNIDPTEAKISWDNSYFGSNGRELYLYDVDSRRIVNMRQQTEYKFFLNERNDFRIVYGDEAFIEAELQPQMVTMNNAFPNPFSNGTTIEFALAESKEDYQVQMDIYNSMGRLIKVLVDRELESGFHQIGWDATNETGQRVADGIYIYKLQVKDGSEVKEFANKLILNN